MVESAPVLRHQFFSSSGALLAGGQLFSYLAGTTTPAATYTDASGSTPNTNPVILDANGSAEVWMSLSTAYKFVLEDANNNVQWTVDNVLAPGSQNFIGTVSAWVNHAVTDGQSATALTGETVDFSLYTSAKYDVEIKRGTTVMANGQLAIQNLNGTGRVLLGLFICNEDHGVTFSLSNVGTVWTLLAALSSGPGSGSIKCQRQLIPI